MRKITFSILTVFLLVFLVACEDFGKEPPAEYTVRYYELIDNSDVTKEITVIEGNYLVEPKVTRQHYELVGWYTNLEDENSKWDFPTTKVTGNTALYAKWEMLNDIVFVNNIRLEDTKIVWDMEIDVNYEVRFLDQFFSLTTNTFDLTPHQDLFNEQVEVTIKPIKLDYTSVNSKVLIKYNEMFENEMLIDFENVSQSSYIEGAFETNGVTLNVLDFLVGSTTSDNKIGEKAARIRQGFIEFTFEYNNFKELSYYIASYGTHGSVDVSLYANNATDEPVLIQTDATTNEPTQISISETVLIDKGIDLGQPITFKIEKAVSSNNLNIDEIKVDVKPIGTFELTNDDEPGELVLTEYYKSAEGLEGEALILELRKIISTNITQTTYGEARDILAVSDRDPNRNYSIVRGMYDGDEIATYWIGTGAGAWQREHVWPNSKLGIPRVNNSSKNQGSDVHNLRAITGINQTRSNRFFTTGAGDPITVGAEAFYPGETDKGDVARILLYMAVMYDVLKLTSNEVLLSNNSKTNYTEAGAYAGKLNLLLEWHLDDPVDQLELNRNELFYSGRIAEHNETVKPQGNRNPFIDHPELFKLVFDYFMEVDETTYLVISNNEFSVYINYSEFKKRFSPEIV